ncbi:MAG: DUF2852 domain-containing protein [Burkholderiaceae bacterium]
MNTTLNPSESMMDPPAPAPAQRRGRCGRAGPWRIAAIVLGFIIFWPIGLALLAWTLWRDQIKAFPLVQKLTGTREAIAPHMHAYMARRPDNAALAEYLDREQQRLRQEQEKLAELVRAFEQFRDAERRSADQRSFDQFLRERATAPDGPAKAD